MSGGLVSFYVAQGREHAEVSVSHTDMDLTTHCTYTHRSTHALFGNVIRGRGAISRLAILRAQAVIVYVSVIVSAWSC